MSRSLEYSGGQIKIPRHNQQCFASLIVCPHHRCSFMNIMSPYFNSPLWAVTGWWLSERPEYIHSPYTGPLDLHSHFPAIQLVIHTRHWIRHWFEMERPPRNAEGQFVEEHECTCTNPMRGTKNHTNYPCKWSQKVSSSLIPSDRKWLSIGNLLCSGSSIRIMFMSFSRKKTSPLLRLSDCEREL